VSFTLHTTMSEPATKSPPSKIRRTRVVVRLPVALRERLAKYSAATGQSERLILENALTRELEGSTDTSYLFERLDQLDWAVREHGRDLQLLAEAFGRYMRLWFGAHAPAVIPREAAKPPVGTANPSAISPGTSRSAGVPSPPNSPKRMTRAEAEALYKAFADDVAEHVSRGHRFIDDMPDLSVERDEPPEPVV
jgi:hypothetical protein